MKYAKPEDIPSDFIESIKGKKTYSRLAKGRARKLNVPLKELPDIEWATIWWNRAKRRERYQERRKIEAVKKEHEELEIPERKGPDISAYLEYYADPAPNDILTMRQLVSHEKQLDQVEALIEKVLEPDEEDKINTGAYKNLVSIQKQLSGEMRLLQENLGISRRIRDQQRSESELADHLRANIDQARELLDEIGTKMYCPHCRAEQGSAILHGFVIDHFPETGLSITKRCPGCGREYTVDAPPKKWVRRIG